MALIPGDLAPHFKCRSSVNAEFNFDTVAGRHIVLTFFASSQLPVARGVLDRIAARRERFDVTNAAFFGVTTDPDDVQRLVREGPGRIYFYDLDLAVSRLYGLVGEPPADRPGAGRSYTIKTFVLDHSLRVVAAFALGKDADRHVEQIMAALDAMPPLATLTTAAPPVLIVPYVFEAELCRELIQYYERSGGAESGFMRDVDGRTVEIFDHKHKRRMDCEVNDERLIRATQERIKRRIVPAIQQAYQFNVTQVERHMVACYDAAQGAHFRAHRDNTTLGTAHRRFAVTINLNSREYEGGEIWFPEFGPRKYKAPSGAAIVFSCSLLHEVPPVTRGRRYAFLPFLYDDAAAAVRQRNLQYLGAASAAGHKPDQCNATPVPSERAGESGRAALAVLDGACGCGNPNGCQTCLSARAYSLDDVEDHQAVAPAEVTARIAE